MQVKELENLHGRLIIIHIIFTICTYYKITLAIAILRNSGVNGTFSSQAIIAEMEKNTWQIPHSTTTCRSRINPRSQRTVRGRRQVPRQSSRSSALATMAVSRVNVTTRISRAESAVRPAKRLTWGRDAACPLQPPPGATARHSFSWRMTSCFRTKFLNPIPNRSSPGRRNLATPTCRRPVIRELLNLRPRHPMIRCAFAGHFGGYERVRRIQSASVSKTNGNHGEELFKVQCV